ncbi:MAG: VOC family protein [Verrucomicrobia bacterium]|nr:VOC family protein [Verrucomicrobiota bacterium]
MSKSNTFVWHELVTSNQEKSGEFFCRLLGWQKREVDAGNFGKYVLFQKEGKDIAGMMNPMSDDLYERAYWHSYIEVDDVGQCAREASRLGGSVIVPPHDVPDVGRVCVLADPMGAVADLIQPVAGFSP